MRKSDVRAEYVINIQKIAGLESIESEEKRGLIFGAMTKLRSIETSKAIQDNYPIRDDSDGQDPVG